MKPYIKAAIASCYIGGIGIFFYTASSVMPDIENTIWPPILMLSLLVLSVCVMAYLFFFDALCLFMEGKRKEAGETFIQTVGAFAAITAALFLMTVFVL